MSKIRVLDLIPKAFSNEQAIVLRTEIEKLLNRNADRIEIDFQGITIFTTLFFNFSTGIFINKLGKEKYDEIFRIENLNDLGESTYIHSYNNCIRDEIKGNADIEAQIMDILRNAED